MLTFACLSSFKFRRPTRFLATNPVQYLVKRLVQQDEFWPGAPEIWVVMPNSSMKVRVLSVTFLHSGWSSAHRRSRGPPWPASSGLATSHAFSLVVFVATIKNAAPLRARTATGDALSHFGRFRSSIVPFGNIRLFVLGGHSPNTRLSQVMFRISIHALFLQGSMVHTLGVPMARQLFVLHFGCLLFQSQHRVSQRHRVLAAAVLFASS